jgi:IclR family acetate operon transcriptional repressor
MGANNSTQVLKTTEISLQLLDLILEKEGASLTELAEVSGLAKSTVHSHLTTLAEYGFVVNENNCYHLGVKFCHLGEYVRTRKEYHRIAEETISRLAEESPFEVDFAVEEHGRVFSLYGDLNYGTTSKFLTDISAFYAHTSASGKAIIAEYDTDHIKEIINNWGLSAATEHSITGEEELFAELEQVREQGYAESHGEGIEGLWVISKAVKSPRGEVYGSINISGPAYAVDDETRETQIDLLEQAATSFEREVVDMYQVPSMDTSKD